MTPLSASSTSTDSGVTFRNPGGDTSALDWCAPELTAQRAWRALCRTFAAEADGRQNDYVKLLVNGEFVRDPAIWPTSGSDEAGPEPWLGRQEKFSGADDVFVFARTVQEHDRTLFRMIVEMLTPHVPRIGLVPGHVEAEVFYGAYRNTPGGIHREGCTNLHLVLDGRKSMHFWRGTDWIPAGSDIRHDVEPEAGLPEEYLPTLDPRDVAGHGHVITATGGAGYFWRSGIWHVGETHQPSIALNIASYTRTLDVAARLLPPWSDRLHGEVPGSWLAEYRAYTSFSGTDADLLARLTALGMRPAPAGAPGTTDDTTATPRRVRRRSTAPVVWAAGPGGRLTVATLGHHADFPDDPGQRAWLAEATTGDVTEVPERYGRLARWLSHQQILEPTEAQ